MTPSGNFLLEILPLYVACDHLDALPDAKLSFAIRVTLIGVCRHVG